MIPCKHCNTFNSLDSTFCKRCGTGLPEDEIEAGKLKLESIVQEGVHALSEGRIEEAMAISETAVAADPSMLSAISLKASVHERKGQIVEALECAERIVELNPNSELDKIKRNQLRAALGAHALHAPPQNRVVPFVAAVSVSLILVCASVLVAHILDRPQAEARVASNFPTTNLPTSLLSPSKIDSGPPAQTQESPKSVPVTAQSPQQVPPSVPQKVDTSDNSEDSGTVKQSSQDATLPPLDVHPLSPPVIPNSQNLNVTPGITANSPSANAKQSTGDPAPTPDPVKVSTTIAPRDNGQISITVHPTLGDSNRGSTGSAEVKDTSKMYTKMGNDSFLIGNYDRAVDRFEKALSSGADPVTVNERLGQSYASLGKKKEAVNAYKRAVDACSSALNSGKGDSSKMRAVRDACETSIRQLQGE